MSIIKWFCAIVGGVAVIASGIVGYTWITVQQKADLKDVLTLKEAKAIRELGDAYYMSIFVRKDNALVDSTTYYWHMKSVFGGALRGSGSIANDPYKVENNKN
jgi:hypothetical protein